MQGYHAVRGENVSKNEILPHRLLFPPNIVIIYIAMEFTPEKFNEIKNEAESFYNKIGFVYCPYFSHKIHFNTSGDPEQD